MSVFNKVIESSVGKVIQSPVDLPHDLNGYTGWTFKIKTDNPGTSNDDQFSIPLRGDRAYNCIIDWGDGTQTVQTNNVSPTHTYPQAGSYIIEITGDFPSLYFNNGGDCQKMVHIIQWGNVAFDIFDVSFFGCSNMTVAPSASNMGNVTSMKEMFRGCTSLIDLDLSTFDTSSVTSFQGTFHGCTNLVNVDLSGDDFDTSNVIHMGAMFYQCSSLETIVGIENFDTSNNANFADMFAFCSSIASIDVTNFDTSSATNMGRMFWDCQALTTLDPSGFDVSGVWDMRAMFRNTDITSLDLSSWAPNALTHIQAMFRDCTELTTVTDMSGFAGTGNAYVEIDQLFWGCEKLTTVGNINNWDTSGITNFYAIFTNCKALTSIDISGWDVSSGISFNSLFNECLLLTSVGDISGWTVSSVTDFYAAFRNCNVLSFVDLTSWNTVAATSMNRMFEGALLFDQDIGGWNITSVTDMTNMLNTVPVSTANYDGILVGWEAQAVQNNVSFRINSQYSAGAPATARAALIADHTWTITDNGQA